MSNKADLDQLKRLSNEANEQMKRQMNLLDGTFNEMMVKLPNDEAKKVERLKVLTQKAILLAKQGKADEAQKIIKEFQNQWA
ncbi:MAG TPA: hypothetical protein VFM82_09450 [Flavobacteriaceae bacterium]|nr:hypothetical protein [Flavobacteriaceae bacterium]